MFFFLFQDVADPLFAHCRLHADKRTTASRVRSMSGHIFLKIFQESKDEMFHVEVE